MLPIHVEVHVHKQPVYCCTVINQQPAFSVSLTVLSLQPLEPIGHVAGEPGSAGDAELLLPLWRVYRPHLGAVGTGVVHQLSQAVSDSAHAVNTHR